MKRAVLLLIALLGLMPALPAWAESSTPPPQADVATLEKQVQDLRKQLDEQRRVHEEEMKVLKQQMVDVMAAQKAAPASAPKSEADELDLAIKRAQAALSSSGSAKPAGVPGASLNFSNPAAPLQSFNPDIGLVGDFQAAHSSTKSDLIADKRFVKELELGIGGNIDPSLRFDSVFSIHPREDGDSGYEIEVEEAYLSPLAKPLGLDMKLGKFRVDFGKVNELHQHALPWPDYPLVIRKFFGDEGLSGEGLSVSWLAPGDKYIELTAQTITKDTDHIFAGDPSSSYVQVGHLKMFTDLDKESTLEWGLSGAVMPRSQLPGSGTTAVEGLDLTYKWRPQKEGLYKSFKWITEVLASQRTVDGRAANAFGFYTAPEYQFARQWSAGLRVDYSQEPDDTRKHTTAAAAYLTFWQSEYCYWRFGYQVSRSNLPDTGSGIDHMLFLQLDFTLGPHPAHKY
jgi:hypothetical protein